MSQLKERKVQIRVGMQWFIYIVDKIYGKTSCQWIELSAISYLGHFVRFLRCGAELNIWHTLQ